MPKLSAGLLVFRRRNAVLEVFLVHPGGPFWQKKDDGAWSIPKGEYAEGDDAEAAARREFEEETGYKTEGEFLSLTGIKQPSGKNIVAWAVEGDFSAANIRSNLFSIEWPPKSGKMQEFPEVDRAEWFSIEHARTKILKGQAAFLDRLAEKLNYAYKSDAPSGGEGEDSSTDQGMLF